MAKKIFVVTHPNLYMKTPDKDGKVAMRRLDKGTEVSMEEKDAESLVKQGKVLVKGQAKKVDITKK